MSRSNLYLAATIVLAACLSPILTAQVSGPLRRIGHTARINAFAVNNDGTAFASVSNDLAAKLWDIKYGRG